MPKIETNDKFDRLTNLDISTHYKDKQFYFVKSSILGAFAYWVVYQSPYDTPDIAEALVAFDLYISKLLDTEDVLICTQSELNDIISDDILETIPEIEILNHPKINSGLLFVSSSRYHTPKPDYDFIDLGALARNIKYMLMRIYICEDC